MEAISHQFKKFSLIVLLFFTVCKGVLAQITNPILLPSEWADYGTGDPYIMKFNGTYYLYCSTRDDLTGVKCWSSPDLVSWTYAGMCSTDPVTKGAYAPEVLYYNGTFYMYTSPAGNGHYVLSSADPTGPFVVKTGNQGKSIDGSAFIDDDGKMYFFHAGNGNIMGFQMPTPLDLSPGDVSLNNVSLAGWTEGPCLIKRNGIYYLTYTGNHVFSKGYRINYSSGTSNPLSSYTQANHNPLVLNSEGTFNGLGHGTTFIGPDLDTYYNTYHNLEGRGSIAGWPVRRFNLTPIGWNSEKMVAYDPFNFPQPSPSLPDFSDRFNRSSIGAGWINVGGGNWGIYQSQLMFQDMTGSVQWYKQVTNNTTAADYTAEFNMKEVGRGSNEARFGVVFSYVDENNYGMAVLSSFYNRIETNYMINGQWQGVQTSPLPGGWDYQKWNCIRVEKENNTFKIYVNGMLKNTRSINGLAGGKTGYTTSDDHADFGYTAFSNQVNGSGIFNFYKPVPGTIEAVHYNSGAEGIAYHDLTPGNTGAVYRNDGVDIRSSAEGGAAIGWNTTGEWYKYNVNVTQGGIYTFALRYATNSSGAKFRLWFDNKDVSSSVSLPNTNGTNNWRTFILQGVQLDKGEHVLKLETVQGDFDFYTLSFAITNNIAGNYSDNFTTNFSSLWNYTDGNWSIQSNEADLSPFGKRAMGNTGWVNYTVEADVKTMDQLDAGIIFRVNNPANGGANDDPHLGADFQQGYYAGINSGAVILGKQNYNWTLLSSTPGSYSINQWYHLKIVVNNDNYKIYVDDMVNPKIDFTDNDPVYHGKVGLRCFNCHARFDNFNTQVSSVTPIDVSTQVSSLINPERRVMIYPNPVTGESLTIDLSGLAEVQPVELNVLDTRGRIILRKEIKGNLNVSLDTKILQSGMYFISIRQGSFFDTQKIIIQN